MAKKRQNVKKIVICEEMDEVLNKPLCFGEKCSYCRSELCGEEWYVRCASKTSDN